MNVKSKQNEICAQQRLLAAWRIQDFWKGGSIDSPILPVSICIEQSIRIQRIKYEIRTFLRDSQ